ncbi:MAG TPA: hypothetical protein VFS96_04035 [Nitrolancea sp.]|nr:hypothetical protein [Nitrolancea sp.]
MGAFQSYLGTATFSIFDASRIAFKSIALFEFVAFALSLYLLTRKCIGRRAALLRDRRVGWFRFLAPRSNHWAGTPLMSDTQERINAADDYDIIVGHGIHRLPEATSRVRAAELPAFVFVTDQPKHEIEGWLQSAAIRYDKRLIPTYVIIRPHQHVEPGEVTRYLSFDR